MLAPCQRGILDYSILVGTAVAQSDIGVTTTTGKSSHMNEYPLLFTIREIVEGQGFVAGIVCNGSALMVNEDADGWHCSGVEPGGLSELGETAPEAYYFFRQAFTDAVRILAGDSTNYSDFETRFNAFFAHKDTVEEQHWANARAAIRAGKDVGDGPFKELPKETAEEPRGCSVVRLDFQRTERQQSEVARQIARAEQVGIAVPPPARVA